MRWNSARIRLFTREAQAPANWPDLTRSAHKCISPPVGPVHSPCTLTGHVCHGAVPFCLVLVGFEGPLARLAMALLTAAFTPDCSLNQSFSPFFPLCLSLNPQVQESDPDEQDFGGYALAFAAGELKPKLKTPAIAATDMLLVCELNLCLMFPKPAARFSCHAGEQPDPCGTGALPGVRDTSSVPSVGPVCRRQPGQLSVGGRGSAPGCGTGRLCAGQQSGESSVMCGLVEWMEQNSD